ncbi:Ionotropic glutamate receptor [Operophtera brumata]|uniref:Ionotropic glutamate receptor n=1 Tax=Operophtera brumata TaxID=104452 RepID=A0A0L7LUE3_OPEBR|nr:Ionotropic glutamate receptor [Operophtera brumata]
MQKVLAEYTNKHPIIVRRLDPKASNQKIFKELYRFQESRILLDCHASRIMQYMKDASILYDKTEASTMVTYYQHYIFASMDAATVAEELRKLDCNSTWLSLTQYDDLKNSPLATRVGKWQGDPLASRAAVPDFELEALIMDDIANHIVKSLSKVENIQKPRNSICEIDADGLAIPWVDGIALQNQILNDRHTVGMWSSADRAGITATQSSIENHSKLKNSKEFRIISKRTRPYFDYKQNCTENCEDDRNPDIKFEGFAVDLVEAIFEILQKEENLNYTYKFIHSEDKEYVPEMFSFLNPYTLEVWLYIATAYCVVSMVLYICARISPADWENPEPCDKDPEFLENIWTFKNCVWLTMGSIMTQGCDILPKAFGTRWVCAMWWFFAVIVCQTYIAQLSASMTSALAEEPINSAEDLIKQNKILYGAYKHGTTLQFFKVNSPFRSDINRAILKLKEQTKLEKIKNKWWKDKYGAKKCKPLTVENDVEGDLEMINLQGAFIVLIGGLFLSLFITAAEFANEVRNIVTHKEVIIQELKASLNFFQLRKPVLRNPSRAPSIDLSEDGEKIEKMSGIQNFLEFEKEVQ